MYNKVEDILGIIFQNHEDTYEIILPQRGGKDYVDLKLKDGRCFHDYHFNTIKGYLENINENKIIFQPQKTYEIY